MIQKMDIEKVEQKANTDSPWIQKYRPTTLRDLISHESILKTLRTFLAENSLPNLLFYGPPGTGKTSTIVALARQMYGKDYSKMVLQLNASDQRGINVVRQSIKSFAGSKTLAMNRNTTKLVILDEADMMTNTAQFALRRIIEKFSSNARFCLISNYVSKIIPALQSRCTRFKFKQIPFQSAVGKIEEICKAQNLKVSKDGIQAVFLLCQGDMRRVVNMLQSLSLRSQTGNQIMAKDVYDFTGNPSPQTIKQMFRIILNESMEKSTSILKNQLRDMGISLSTVVTQFYQLLLNTELPSKQKAYLVNRLGDIQYRLSIGCKQSIQLATLIGAFTQIKFMA